MSAVECLPAVESRASPSPAPGPGTTWRWFAVLTVAAIPLVDLGWGGLELKRLPKRGLHPVPYDAMVWIAAAWLLAGSLLRGDTGRRRARMWGVMRPWLRCVWPALPLLAVSLLSVTRTRTLDSRAVLLLVKNSVQWSEYLLLTPLVCLSLMADRRWRDRACWGLTISSLFAITAIAWRTPLDRVFGGEIHPYAVGGLLGNRNTCGLFLAVTCSLLAGWALELRADKPRALLLLPIVLLPFLAGYTCLAAGALVALCLGVGVAYASRNPAGVLFPLLLLAVLLAAGDARGRRARLRALARSVQTFRPRRTPGEVVAASAPTMRAYRWAADLNMIAANPILGVGWGQYQRRVNDYYGDIAHPEGNTALMANYDLTANEPFTFSWYFVVAGESGLLGLGALLALLAGLASRTLGTGAAVGCCCNAGGMAGALLALVVAGLWTSPMVRGAGPLLGVMLAMSALPGTNRTPDAQLTPAD